MDGPRRVTLRVGQNGAEELPPPGPAILVRGMETLTVMSPYLPDDERAQRLNALRLGEIELSDAQREKLALQAARGTRHAGKKPTVRGVYDRLKGRVGWVRESVSRWGLFPRSGVEASAGKAA
jgi:hypothetical protein